MGNAINTGSQELDKELEELLKNTPDPRDESPKLFAQLSKILLREGISKGAFEALTALGVSLCVVTPSFSGWALPLDDLFEEYALDLKKKA